MEPKTTGKRIVSKGEYVKVQGKGESLTDATRRWVVSVTICLVVWAVLSPLFYEGFYRAAKGVGDFRDWLVWLAFFLFPLLLVAVSTTRQVIVKTREQYFPITRANTTDLSAPDSLVRASEEPIHAQVAVLLRAATEGQETPPEQLVRAVGKGE